MVWMCMWIYILSKVDTDDGKTKWKSFPLILSLDKLCTRTTFQRDKFVNFHTQHRTHKFRFEKRKLSWGGFFFLIRHSVRFDWNASKLFNISCVCSRPRRHLCCFHSTLMNAWFVYLFAFELMMNFHQARIFVSISLISFLRFIHVAILRIRSKWLLAIEKQK